MDKRDVKGRAKSLKRVEKATKKAAKQTSATVAKASSPRIFHPFKQPTWQNPLIEFFDSRHRRRAKPRVKPSRRVVLERRILAMLACFSISVGLWENFRQLWLQTNGFSVTGVSNMIGFGMVMGIIAVLLAGKFVKMPKIKSFMTLALIVSAANLLTLNFLNQTGWTLPICFCTALDVVTSALVGTSVYPLLTTVMKSNHTYSRRKLVEYLFRDCGILIGGLLIGRTLGTFVVDYNFCLLIAAVFSISAAFILYHTDITMTESAPATRFSIVKYILKSRLHRTYMLYALVAGAAFYTVVGLKMLLLTEYFSLSASMATNYLLLVGLAADALGILALRYFTPKNDYITLGIKFGTRFILFTCAFLSGDLFVCFVCFTWTILSSTAYENITDGYYINAVDNRHQLKYNTTKHIVTTSGEAVGMFLCGQMFQLGAGYMFGLSAVLIAVQLVIGFRLIYIRHKLTRPRSR